MKQNNFNNPKKCLAQSQTRRVKRTHQGK